MTPAELIAAVNDGTLRIADRINCLPSRIVPFVHLANASDMNAAMFVRDYLLGDAWLWHGGYDNRVILTSRDDQEIKFKTISLSLAHALLLGTLQAWLHDTAKAESGAGVGLS